MVLFMFCRIIRFEFLGNFEVGFFLINVIVYLIEFFLIFNFLI